MFAVIRFAELPGDSTVCVWLTRTWTLSIPCAVQHWFAQKHTDMEGITSSEWAFSAHMTKVPNNMSGNILLQNISWNTRRKLVNFFPGWARNEHALQCYIFCCERLYLLKTHTGICTQLWTASLAFPSPQHHHASEQEPWQFAFWFRIFLIHRCKVFHQWTSPFLYQMVHAHYHTRTSVLIFLWWFSKSLYIYQLGLKLWWIKRCGEGLWQSIFTQPNPCLFQVKWWNKMFNQKSRPTLNNGLEIILASFTYSPIITTINF